MFRDLDKHFGGEKRFASWVFFKGQFLETSGVTQNPGVCHEMIPTKTRWHDFIVDHLGIFVTLFD